MFLDARSHKGATMIKDTARRSSAHLVVRRCGDEVIKCDGGEVKGCVAHVALLFVIVSVGVGSHIYFACSLVMFDVCHFNS